MSVVAEAARFRSFTPITRDRYRSFGLSLLERDDVSIEMIHNREVLGYVLSNRSDQMRRFLESEKTAYYRTDATFPFGLVFEDAPDRRVGLTFYDEDARLRAFVAAESPEAYEWADELYESYRREAELLSVGVLAGAESDEQLSAFRTGRTRRERSKRGASRSSRETERIRNFIPLASCPRFDETRGGPSGTSKGASVALRPDIFTVRPPTLSEGTRINSIRQTPFESSGRTI